MRDTSSMADVEPGAEAADLLSAHGVGPVWGAASADLNATLLEWPAGHEVGEHTNAELDVLLVVLDGAGVALVNGHEYALGRGSALLIDKGTSRTIRAADPGIRYLSIHRRRGPLQIARGDAAAG